MSTRYPTPATVEWVSHGARYYNSEWGRFISPDPKREFHNQYSYCWDNPINRVDLDGRSGPGISVLTMLPAIMTLADRSEISILDDEYEAYIEAKQEEIQEWLDEIDEKNKAREEEIKRILAEDKQKWQNTGATAGGIIGGSTATVACGLVDVGSGGAALTTIGIQEGFVVGATITGTNLGYSIGGYLWEHRYDFKADIRTPGWPTAPVY